MNEQGRYEIKFVLNDNEYNEAMNWLYCHTQVLSKYPSRQINSLYFDNIQFQSIQDNLSGIAKRHKTRLRWYHGSKEEVSIPFLEIKAKQGRLGYKHKFKLPKLQNDIFNVNFKDMTDLVKRQLMEQKESVNAFDEYLTPALYVNYNRQYFEDHEGLRLTIDNDINFCDILPYKKLGQSSMIVYPNRIMEIKFEPAQKNKVSDLLKNLHICAKRHSKYLTGMAMFGKVHYL